MHSLLRTIACVSLATALVVPSSSVNARALFAYPMKGQSLEQENRDRLDCHNWAVRQTGFSPSGVPEERRQKVHLYERLFGLCVLPVRRSD